MRIVIQRVSHASVTIEGHCKSAIGKGMLILVGIEEADGQEDIDWLCKKIVNLRIFDDENPYWKTEEKFWLSASSLYMLPPKKGTVLLISKLQSRKYRSHSMRSSAKI